MLLQKTGQIDAASELSTVSTASVPEYVPNRTAVITTTQQLPGTGLLNNVIHVMNTILH